MGGRPAYVHAAGAPGRRPSRDSRKSYRLLLAAGSIYQTEPPSARSISVRTTAVLAISAGFLPCI